MALRSTICCAALLNQASDLHLKVGNHPLLARGRLAQPQTDVRALPRRNAFHGVQHDDQPPKTKIQETAELDMLTASPAWADSA